MDPDPGGPNTWIRWIHRIQIRIRNTAAQPWLTITAFLLHRKNLKGRTRKCCIENIWQMSMNYLTRKKRKTSLFVVGENKKWRHLSFLALSAFWATFKLNWRTSEPKWSHYMSVERIGLGQADASGIEHLYLLVTRVTSPPDPTPERLPVPRYCGTCTHQLLFFGFIDICTLMYAFRQTKSHPKPTSSPRPRDFHQMTHKHTQSSYTDNLEFFSVHVA